MINTHDNYVGVNYSMYSCNMIGQLNLDIRHIPVVSHRICKRIENLRFFMKVELQKESNRNYARNQQLHKIV